MSTAPTPAATSPPPPGVGGALPLQIGKAFIKQYYKTLVNTPAQLNRFYQPDSTVSRGMEPSAPTDPFSVADVVSAPTNGEETTQGERVRKTFFDWAGKGIDEGGEDTDDILRIELQGGAIDAQESVGGGILLVVTGHMYLPGKSSEKADSFVHTFFLNNGAPPGRKKQFYVKNDILRFLEPAVAEEEDEVVEEAAEEPEVAETPETQAEEPSPEPEEAPVEVAETAAAAEPIEYEPAAEEEKVEVADEEVQEPMAELSIEEEPAADEEKIDVSTSSEESPPPSPTSVEGKKKRRRRRGGKSRSRSNSPGNGTADAEEDKGEQQPKPPSSWANLVASGASKKSETSASDNKKSSRSKGGSSKPDEKSSAKSAPAKAPPQSQPPTKESATQPQATQNKRTPEATLFIRNIPDPTKEEEIRALFEPHGNATGNKILGITLNTNRGFCFVDFDGQAAVDAIVDEAKSSLVKDPRTGRKDKSSFMAHGRVLDVERKVPGDRKSSGGNNGGNSGKFNRSSSPKDSGRRYGNRGSRGGGGGGGGGGSRRSQS
eukprot:CAMPEP_0201686926 /NCGR_PEP_ID=MMETSP0578-20130828/1188_1 /ASSEMBLY_ACC=CAM_ASM_000663 /TAXON_ID=267565 /ORGANISM="Skeletonema grethea, Strain CCMP 1804" /LENGTH=545 /DNA_ID=CAMNT_0048171033 /DNA_START=166 /DNA_END=1803 /DNA_ORIENTATION=+